MQYYRIINNMILNHITLHYLILHYSLLNSLLNCIFLYYIRLHYVMLYHTHIHTHTYVHAHIHRYTCSHTQIIGLWMHILTCVRLRPTRLHIWAVFCSLPALLTRAGWAPLAPSAQAGGFRKEVDGSHVFKPPLYFKLLHLRKGLVRGFAFVCLGSVFQFFFTCSSWDSSGKQL